MHSINYLIHVKSWKYTMSKEIDKEEELLLYYLTDLLIYSKTIPLLIFLVNYILP